MRISRLLIAALLALAPSLALAQGAPGPLRLPKGSTGPADSLTVGGTAISAILGSKAPLANPAFSGTVTAPSLQIQPSGTNAVDGLEIGGSLPGDPARFWSAPYFGNTASGKVLRSNRGLFGIAAGSGGGRPASPSTWPERYFTDIIADSQLASVSALGGLAVTGVARTSDFRTWTGAAAGGSQGVSGFGVNDDLNPASTSAVAAGIYGEVIRLPGAPGLTEAAEFTINNGGNVVDITPFGGVTSGATFAGNFTVGYRAAYNKYASAALLIGGTNNGARFRKGLVALDGFDPALGRGGKGVPIELGQGMSIRWLDSSGAVKGELFGGPDGLSVGGRSVEGAWEQTVSTVSTSSGSLGSATGQCRSKRLGRTVNFRCNATIAANGSGNGALYLSLPYSAAGDTIVVGRAPGVPGMLTGVISGSNNVVGLLTSADGYPGADGRTVVVSGSYEALAD